MTLSDRLLAIAETLASMAQEPPNPAMMAIVIRRVRNCAADAQHMRRTIDEYDTDAAADELICTICDRALQELDTIVAEGERRRRTV